MAETSMPYDVSGWGFDPMNPGPGFNLEPGLSDDEELWYKSQLGMNAFDQGHLQPEETLAGYDFATPGSGKIAYQLPTHPMEGFHSRADKLLPRYGWKVKVDEGETDSVIQIREYADPRPQHTLQSR
jgi:hypothetical protein